MVISYLLPHCPSAARPVRPSTTGDQAPSPDSTACGKSMRRLTHPRKGCRGWDGAASCYGTSTRECSIAFSGFFLSRCSSKLCPHLASTGTIRVGHLREGNGGLGPRECSKGSSLPGCLSRWEPILGGHLIGPLSGLS